MAAQRLWRRVSIDPYVANGEVIVEIPRAQDIMGFMVRLIGTFTNGALNSDASYDAAAQLIKRVDVIANAKDVLHSIAFRDAAIANYARHFAGVYAGIAYAGDAVTANVDITAMLDRQNYDGQRPKDSAFQAYLTNLLQIRFQFGSPVSDAGGSAGATFVGQVETYVDSLNEDTGKGEAKAIKKVTTQSVNFTAANSNLRVRLPTGNMMRSIIIRASEALEAGIPNQPSDTLVNYVQMSIENIDVRYNTSWLGIRRLNSFDREIQDVPFTDDSRIPTGYAVIDFSKDGKLTECLNLTGASIAELSIDVRGPANNLGQLDVITEEYILPVAAAA